VATNFVARDGDKLVYPAFIVLLAFYSRWEYRNADYCVNIDDDFSTSDKNLVNWDPLIPEILWLICMGGECT